MSADAPPFHPDELEAQARAGGGPKGAAIRDYMPDQHRAFFSRIPYLFIALADSTGWPIATLLTGAPGFADAPDPNILRINTVPAPQDPAAAALRPGVEIGVIGIDFGTRRRNRANGSIREVDGKGFTVAVRQSFGNCPQYIQRRAVALTTDAAPAPTGPSASPETPMERFETLDQEAQAQIERSDTFFIASRSRPEAGAQGGLDISHRGGRPGFIRVNGNVLTIPDFRGNRYFNTLGNLLGEPRAALLFVDFERGDILQLQGRARIDWSATPEARLLNAERLWYFETIRGVRRRAASPLRATFIDYSPMTLQTGTWRDELARS